MDFLDVAGACMCFLRFPGYGEPMTATVDISAPVDSPLRRNISILALAQALFQSIQTMAIATTPLAALSILGPDAGLVSSPQFSWLGLTRDSQLATIPIFLAHLGR